MQARPTRAGRVTHAARRPAAGMLDGLVPEVLDGLLHLAALEAAGADVGAAGDAVHEHPDPLEVRIEAAVRRHHRVGAVVPETGLLPAD